MAHRNSNKSIVVPNTRQKYIHTQKQFISKLFKHELKIATFIHLTRINTIFSWMYSNINHLTCYIYLQFFIYQRSRHNDSRNLNLELELIDKVLKGMQWITLSNFCSDLRFAMPPHNREVPRTRRRLERMEPRREYLTTSILLLLSAKIAMMSSVAFPHVAFKSPPTVIHKIYKWKTLETWLAFKQICNHNL